MSDLISRQALCEYAFNQKDKCVTPNDIMRFPSAQPETHDKRTETHACDLINRQQAIDAVKELCLHYTPTKSVKHPHIDFVVEELERLPSAQPDDRLAKIAELVEGTIDHFDRDDAMDLLYQIKEVLK